MTITATKTVLHLGCGRRKLEMPEGAELINLDAEEHLNPDIVCKLGRDPIPLPDDSVDLAIAHHVLEHIGKQGETDEWFFFWEELYRVMKPDGELHFESPLYSSVWCWGDPQHTRALSPQAFIFFDQDNYRIPDSSISPYKIKCDFKPDVFTPLSSGDEGTLRMEKVSHFSGRLKAEKPLRPWWED